MDIAAVAQIFVHDDAAAEDTIVRGRHKLGPDTERRIPLPRRPDRHPTVTGAKHAILCAADLALENSYSELGKKLTRTIYIQDRAKRLAERCGPIDLL